MKLLAPGLRGALLHCRSLKLPGVAERAIAAMIGALGERSCCPYSAPVWAGAKAEGRWCLATDYGKLNNNPPSLTAAAPSTSTASASWSLDCSQFCGCPIALSERFSSR